MDNIKLPIHLTKFTTNKKSSSDKKSVAILNRGIGLFTGEICHSRKIVNSCMSFGEQFKPNRDFNVTIINTLQIRCAIKSQCLWLFIVMGVFALLLQSCSGEAKDERNKTISQQTLDSLSLSLEKYYIIEKNDNDQANIRLYVYVSDTEKIKEIKELLIGKYNNDKSKFMGVFFFDKKGIGEIYMEKELNNKASEKEKNKLFKHLIAIYNFNPSNSYEKLEFEEH